MAKRKIFYSFHFDNDVMRVQQVRNIGVLEGNEPVSKNAWEEVKKKGDESIKKWIDDHMTDKSCVVVLIGSKTSERKWVDYEIRKAWDAGKGVLGIHIHNLKCPNNGKDVKGLNPFHGVNLTSGKKLSEFAPCFDPNSLDAYNDIANNIDSWIEKAIKANPN